MEGFAVGLEVRHKVPIKHRLTVRFEFLHQFALDGQQVVKAHKDIRAACDLLLDGVVIPMLDNRPLAHAGIAFLLSFHLGMQRLVQRIELIPDDGIAAVYRIGAVLRVGVDEAVESFAGVRVELELLERVRSDGIIEEIGRLLRGHGRIDIGEVGNHLASPSVEHIERHEVRIAFTEAAVMAVEAHDGKEFVFGVERTEGILQLRQGLHIGRPDRLAVLGLLETHQFVFEHQAGAVRRQDERGVTQLTPFDMRDDRLRGLL